MKINVKVYKCVKFENGEIIEDYIIMPEKLKRPPLKKGWVVNDIPVIKEIYLQCDQYGDIFVEEQEEITATMVDNQTPDEIVDN